MKASRLLECLESLIPQLEDYVADEGLREDIKQLKAENIRLKNHVMGQDRIIAELQKVQSGNE